MSNKFDELFSSIAVSPQYAKDTIAWIIEQYITAMRQPGAYGVSEGRKSAFGILQRSPALGERLALELKLADLMQHGRLRRANQVPTLLTRKTKLAEISPSTITKDFSNLMVVLTWANDELSMPLDAVLAVIAKAKRKLKKEGIIAKSTPRDRRPTIEEHRLRLEFFAKQDEHQNTIIPMGLMDRWQMASSRRIGESCKLLWSDWDRENHTILVRKMKDPRKKNKAKFVALPPDAEAILYELLEKRDHDEPRIFPYNSKSVSQRSTLANQELAKLHPGMFLNLHLHDARRDRATRLVEDDRLTPAEAIQVTGHDNTTIFEKNYMRLRPENVAKRWEKKAPSEFIKGDTQ